MNNRVVMIFCKLKMDRVGKQFTASNLDSVLCLAGSGFPDCSGCPQEKQASLHYVNSKKD